MQSLGLEVLFKGKNFERLMGGMWTALRISLISIAISMVLGLLLGFLMSRGNRFVRGLMRCYLEFVHIMPQMVLLFLVFFGTSKAFGWNLSGELSSVIVFSLWGTAEMSDLVRGAVTSVPKIQYESAMALVLMIGVVEILKVAQQIIEANRKASPNAAFGVYLTVFLMYFLLCWPVSLLAKRLEKRWG